jgi:hypothetical protein
MGHMGSISGLATHKNLRNKLNTTQRLQFIHRNIRFGKFIKSQCSETNVMHFLLNLLQITGLYMFQALLAHPQGVLHNQHLVYCVRVMSVGCTRIKVDI